MKIPALTLHEPWATWIAVGLKTIETRTHDRYKSLIGKQIAIHAGQRFDKGAIKTAHDALLPDASYNHHSPTIETAIELLSKLIAAARNPRHGHVVCMSHIWATRWLSRDDSPDALIDCTPQNAGSRECVKRFGFFLGETERVLDPTVYKGHQGIWTWTPRSAAQINAAKRIPRALAEPDNRSRRRRNHYGGHPTPKGLS